MPFELTAIKKTNRKPRLTMEEVPEDIKQAAEEIFAHCQDNPDERVSVKVGTQEEADAFLHAIRSYCYHREPRLASEGTPTKKGFARVSIAPYDIEAPSDKD